MCIYVTYAVRWKNINSFIYEWFYITCFIQSTSLLKESIQSGSGPYHPPCIAAILGNGAAATSLI